MDYESAWQELKKYISNRQHGASWQEEKEIFDGLAHIVYNIEKNNGIAKHQLEKAG